MFELSDDQRRTLNVFVKTTRASMRYRDMMSAQWNQQRRSQEAPRRTQQQALHLHDHKEEVQPVSSAQDPISIKQVFELMEDSAEKYMRSSNPDIMISATTQRSGTEAEDGTCIHLAATVSST